MKESLTSRVGRLISGSLNTLVNAMENAVPEAVMEEAIREIDGAIDEVRAELGRVMANKHLANTRLMEENRKHETLSVKIELAVSEGRDDLAEAAIARQLDIEAQIPVLESTVVESATQEKELEAYIYALQAKKREMQDDLRQYKASRQESFGNSVSSAGGNLAAGGRTQAKVEKAGDAFDRIMERSTGIAGVGVKPDRKTAVQLAELDELSRNNRVQERLAAVKKNTNKG